MSFLFVVQKAYLSMKVSLSLCVFPLFDFILYASERAVDIEQCPDTLSVRPLQVGERE